MSNTSALVDFEVVALQNGTFAVSIRAGGGLPRIVSGFGTQAEAERWILLQAESPSRAEGLPYVAGRLGAAGDPPTGQGA